MIVSGSDHGDCEGSCAFPGGALKGNSSGLLMSLSYLTCGYVLAVSICWTRFVQHLLAAEPPTVGQHNEDLRVVGIFNTQINLQVNGYRCTFHPKVFEVSYPQENV